MKNQELTSSPIRHLARAISPTRPSAGILLALSTLAAGTAAQQGPPPSTLEEHVVREIVGRQAGARLGEVVIIKDVDLDGHRDAFLTARGINEVLAVDGKFAQTQTIRGPSRSNFGADIALGDVTQAGRDDLVIASTGNGSGGYVGFVNPTYLAQSRGGFQVPATRGLPRNILLANADNDPEKEILVYDPTANSAAGRMSLYDPGSQSWRWTTDGVGVGANFGAQAVYVPRTTGLDKLYASEPGTDTIWDVDLTTGARTALATHGMTGALGRDGLVAATGGLVVASSEFTGLGAMPNGIVERYDYGPQTWTTLYQGAADERITSLTRPDVNDMIYLSSTVPTMEEVREINLRGGPVQLRLQGPAGEGLRVHGDGFRPMFNNTATEVIALSSPFRAGPFGRALLGATWMYSLTPLDARVEESRRISGETFRIHANFRVGRAGNIAFPLLSGTGNDRTAIPGLNLNIALQGDAFTNASLGVFLGSPFTLDAGGKATAQFNVPSAPLGGQIFGLSFGWVGFGSGGFFANQDGTGSHAVIR